MIQLVPFLVPNLVLDQFTRNGNQDNNTQNGNQDNDDNDSQSSGLLLEPGTVIAEPVRVEVMLVVLWTRAIVTIVSEG